MNRTIKDSSHKYYEVLDFLATFYDGCNGLGGRLLITNEFIIFKAHKLNFGDVSDRYFYIKDIIGYKKGPFKFLYIYFANRKVVLSVWKKQEIINALEVRRSLLET